MKVYSILSAASELLLKLKPSWLYVRFMMVLYFLSIYLIYYSALPLLVKLLLIFLIALQLKRDLFYRQPHTELCEIYCTTQQQWYLLKADGLKEDYQEVRILIGNPIFQLIKLLGSEKNRLIILFNDQLTNEQLRQLYLKVR